MPKASGCACGGVSSAIAPSCRPKRRSISASWSSGSSARRCGTFSSPLGPDDRGAVPERPAGRERQDREGPGGQEMLDRAALVVALMRDRRDDRRIAGRTSRPSRCRPPRAAASARRRRRPGDGRASLPPPASSTADRLVLELEASRPPRGAGRRRPPGRPSIERGHERAALDHVGEGLAGLDLAVEGQEHRPHRVARPGCR